MRLERDTCWECGRKETWRSAWRWRRLRRKVAPVPPDPFAEWVSSTILDELRPRPIAPFDAWLRKEREAEQEAFLDTVYREDDE